MNATMPAKTAEPAATLRAAPLTLLAWDDGADDGYDSVD